MGNTESQATVAVVLCTYNGSTHLDTQLETLVSQTWPIALYAFDDASTDDTVAKLRSYSNLLNITICVNNQNLGFVSNFEAGIARVLNDGYKYIALCDQDDLWEPDRIASGMQSLLSIEAASEPQLPVLVHSDLTMIDANNQPVHKSFFEYRQYAINNSQSLPTVLGQNGVMGNTILMNRALATIAIPFPSELHVHDYWLAVLSELFGHREQLSEALVSYRIHNDNASNSIESTKFGIARLLDGKSWQGFIRRDYRLPFKEDSRIVVINTLLSRPANLPELNVEQRELLTRFQAYLEFKQPRASLLYSMLTLGFFRKGVMHRMRLAYSTLLTKRYQS